jgi:hypothetical protein
LLKIFQNFLDSRQRQNETEIEVDILSKKYKLLSANQISHILDVIQEEVVESDKFGLIIQPEHLLNEKIILLTVFNQWGQALNKIGEKDNVFLNHFERIVSYLADLIFDLLSEEVKYYFDHALPGEVKNRYNCHLSVLIPRLVRDFFNQKCVPAMSYSK